MTGRLRLDQVQIETMQMCGVLAARTVSSSRSYPKLVNSIIDNTSRLPSGSQQATYATDE